MSEADDLDDWLSRLCEALGVPVGLTSHRPLLLDVARDAAHEVMRPAAPLTTFLVGYAAGQASPGNADAVVVRAAATARKLAVARGQDRRHAVDPGGEH